MGERNTPGGYWDRLAAEKRLAARKKAVADNVCLSCERPLRPVPEQPDLDICECDAAGAPPAWDR